MITVGYREVESVDIVDTFSKGVCHPSVQVCSKARARPLKLEGFSIDTPELKSILMRAADESRERHVK